MARRESRSLAGFFPLPPHLIPTIGAMVRPDWSGSSEDLILVDPCAGEGEALRLLRDAVSPADRSGSVLTYACEMEQTRWQKLREFDPKRQWHGCQGHHLHGDFFHVRFSPGFADLLLLNPPYDQDRQYRRLEARWLHACAPMLTTGGVLVFVVPHYALAACADTLALHFADLRCLRFPGEDFETFKQVFLFARRVERAAPDPAIAAQVRAWSDDASGIPDLPSVDQVEPYRAATRKGSNPGFARVDRDVWSMAGSDVAGVAALPPWHTERGPAPDLDHPADVVDRIGAVYPVVSPPKPVHLAAALSAGVFNGLHVRPNDGHALPALLVKGTFRRRWDTVEQKHDKDGDLTGEVQVERPELQVYALDLATATYHALASSAEVTSATTVAELTFADLLDRYSAALLAALRGACPVLHDPTTDQEPPVDGLGRPLWAPQASVVHAVGKLLDQPGRGALIVGEVGTGKTSIALALQHVRGVARSLVICPPHLLASWTAQVRTVLPHADVVVLDSLSAVDALRAHPGPVVALLSREAAKLGHGWAGLDPVLGRPVPTCPRCGAMVIGDRHAERRVRCDGGTLRARSPLGRWVLRHAALLVRCDPQNVSLHGLVPATAMGQRFLAWAQKHPVSDALHQRLTDALAELYALLLDQPEARDRVLPAVAWARPSTAPAGLAAIPSYRKGDESTRALVPLRERIGFACDVLPDLGVHPDEHPGYAYGHGIPGRYGQKTAEDCWRPFRDGWAYTHGTWEARPDPVHRHYTPSEPAGFQVHGKGYQDDGPGFERNALRGHARGSAEALSYALTRIVMAAKVRTAGCGEPLFQATPTPRRFPVGTYIARYAADIFGMLVIDEAHEYASETSAQGIVSTRLAQMAQKRGIPVLYMTGSLVNGYADSAFHALRAVSPKFRAEFGHGDRERFVDQYGLRKRVLVYETDKGGSVARGAHSERVLSGVKKAGMAPGVIPVLLLDHLLGSSAIIHKADLDIGLPGQSEETARIDLTPALAANLDGLLETVKKAIRETRFVKGCAGKLFGAVTKLLSYPDVAACGDYEVRWPEAVPSTVTRSFTVEPGGLVARVPRLDPTVLLPKEAWLLDLLRDEGADRRGVMVLPAHVELLDRLAWICDQAGIESVVLWSEKVPPAKREAWIDRHLNRKARRVLIVNPTCVQTGLNNLVSLATSVWYENPECKPIVYRQANGRIHRPGQTLPVRSMFPLYGHKLPEAGHKLLLHKVGVSLAVDGLDPDAVLEAAGVASEFSAGLNVGQQLYRMLVEAAGE